MENILELSTLPKTWLFDLDGTLVKHNGYKIDGKDTILEGVLEYFEKIPKEDTIVILTARKSEYKEMTIDFLKKIGLRYTYILFDMPMGERIIVNDRKDSGLQMSYAFNLKRDEFELPEFVCIK